MSKEKFFIADPFNKNHIAMIENFEKRAKLSSKLSESLKLIAITKTKEEYENNKKNQININENLFLYNSENKITDYCYLQGEKDRKACTLFFISLKTSPKVLITLASEYAFNILNMEDIFISISKGDTSLSNTLIMQGFENLGEINGKLTFLKQREEVKESLKGNKL